jgi:hypothetical protein
VMNSRRRIVAPMLGQLSYRLASRRVHKIAVKWVAGNVRYSCNAANDVCKGQ